MRAYLILLSMLLYSLAFSQHQDASQEKKSKELKKTDFKSTQQLQHTSSNKIEIKSTQVKKTLKEEQKPVIIESGTSKTEDLPKNHKKNFRSYMTKRSDKKAPLKARKID